MDVGMYNTIRIRYSRIERISGQMQVYSLDGVGYLIHINEEK